MRTAVVFFCLDLTDPDSKSVPVLRISEGIRQEAGKLPYYSVARLENGKLLSFSNERLDGYWKIDLLSVEVIQSLVKESLKHPDPFAFLLSSCVGQTNLSVVLYEDY